MDVADHAQQQIEANLTREIEATRALIPTVSRTHCVDCDDELSEHRQIWGICIACKEKRETRDRRRLAAI
jgi:hypothetical protein